VGSHDGELPHPSTHAGNPAEAMMGDYAVTSTGVAEGLEVAFGINTHQSLISSYLPT